MNIVEMQLSELKPYDNNPRHNNVAVQPVANSIREFGLKVPIVVDADNVIIAGHTQYRAAQQLGLDTVPCIVADDLSPQQSNAGGMTSTYLDNGTFVKSFYSVMYSPSCVKIAAMGDKHMRMHHRVNWDCRTPKILNQRWKKSKGG